MSKKSRVEIEFAGQRVKGLAHLLPNGAPQSTVYLRSPTVHKLLREGALLGRLDHEEDMDGSFSYDGYDKPHTAESVDAFLCRYANANFRGAWIDQTKGTMTVVIHSNKSFSFTQPETAHERALLLRRRAEARAAAKKG